MMTRFFEWDAKKAQTNLRKHNISFEEAALVFDDPLAISVQDRIENGEYRWKTIGIIGNFVLLVVAHTVIDHKNNTEVIRIISARRADKKEKRRYEHCKI